MLINKISIDQVIISENFYQYPKIFHPYREKNKKGDTVRPMSKYCEMRNESKILHVYLKNRFHCQSVINLLTRMDLFML